MPPIVIPIFSLPNNGRLISQQKSIIRSDSTQDEAWNITSQVQREIMNGRRQKKKVLAFIPSTGETIKLDKIIVDNDLVYMNSGSDRHMMTPATLKSVVFKIGDATEDNERQKAGFGIAH